MPNTLNVIKYVLVPKDSHISILKNLTANSSTAWKILLSTEPKKKKTVRHSTSQKLQNALYDIYVMYANNSIIARDIPCDKNNFPLRQSFPSPSLLSNCVCFRMYRKMFLLNCKVWNDCSVAGYAASASVSTL